MDDQSYIIRIYRCASRTESSRRVCDAVALAGIVESSSGDLHLAFHNMEELWAILARGAGADTKRRSKRAERR